MNTWLALSLVLGLVALVAVWSRTPTRARGLAVVASLAGMPIAGGLLVSAHGWPVKPVAYLAELPKGKFKILGLLLRQNVAIYITLDVGGTPRLFELPWSNERASKLQRAMEAGNEITGESTRGKKKIGGGTEKYPVEFHDTPPQENEAKETEQPGATL